VRAGVRGYGIQAAGGQFVSRIEGCFYNVMVQKHGVSLRCVFTPAVIAALKETLCFMNSLCKAELLVFIRLNAIVSIQGFPMHRFTARLAELVEAGHVLPPA